MSTEKKSFLLYCGIVTTVAKLSDEQAGKLFKIILEYVNGNNPVIDDQILDIAFDPIRQAIIRNAEKYENICKRNINNGLKGGRPKTQINPKKPKKPSGLLINPEEPKKTDSDIDSVNDNVIVIDNNIYSENLFNDFWEKYKKGTNNSSIGNKKKSKQKFLSLDNSTQDLIIKHLDTFFLVKPFETYTFPLAETYLNQERWNDEKKTVVQNNIPISSNGRTLKPPEFPEDVTHETFIPKHIQDKQKQTENEQPK